MSAGALVRVVVMGDGAVGKTTLSIQFTANRFVDYYDPTIEDTYVRLLYLYPGSLSTHLPSFSPLLVPCSLLLFLLISLASDRYRKQCTIDGTACMVEILDTAGQEDFSMLMGQWIRSYHGFLLIYSITLRSSFNTIPKIHKLVTRTRDTDTVPLVLVGNKCDLETKREVSTAEGQALAQQISAEFAETSAKTRHNVEHAFFSAVRQHWRMHQPSPEKRKRAICALL